MLKGAIKMAIKTKLKSLEHNGVILPPTYKSPTILNGKTYYFDGWFNKDNQPKEYELDGIKIPNTGDDSTEEMLWHYATKLETEYVKSDVFNKNFYTCLYQTLPEKLKNKSFPKDYMPLLKEMFKDNEKLKESKKAFQKEHKAELEKQKEEMKEMYGFAMLDGKKQPLGAYLIEGPGIFIQRGEGPILGMWKYRTKPEDITINFVGSKEKEPKAPQGHHWKEVEHNKNAMHIAIYKVNIGNITEKIKEIRFGNNSDVKADADKKKFAKAAKLLRHMKEMEAHIRNGLESKDEKRKQCAVACWLIQNTGIRVGGEKDTSIEADTVGMTTLKVSNVSVEL